MARGGRRPGAGRKKPNGQPEAAPVESVPQPAAAPVPVAQNFPESRVSAVAMVAADELTETEMADRLGVDRRTLYNWRQDPDFAAAVKAARERLGEAALRYTIGRRLRRVAVLDEKWRAIQEVIAKRGADPDHAKAPGGSTGLLVRRLKQIGGGENAREVEEFEYDVALMKDFRELPKQAAEELFQREPEGTGTRSQVTLVVLKLGKGVSMDDL